MSPAVTLVSITASSSLLLLPTTRLTPRVTAVPVAVASGGYNNLGTLDAQYFQAGVYVQHVATGLFGLINYGDLQIRRRCRHHDSETWYFKGGLRTKFNHLGATVFYGEYLNG